MTGPTIPCPWHAPVRTYDVTAFDHPLPTEPFGDTEGIVYALSSDYDDIRFGKKALEPLVLRVNRGDCVKIVLRNKIGSDTLYGGDRAGFSASMLSLNPQLDSGAAVQAAIFPPHTPAFREFALTLHATDQHFSRSVIPYMNVVAGNGINQERDGGGEPPVRPAPIAGAPPGTADNNGSFDKGYTHVNYASEPMTARIGLTDAPGHVDLDGDGVEDPGWFDPGFQLDAPFHSALSSTVHGNPSTPVLQTYAGDPVVFRVAVPASDQFHSFVISGHTFPLEPDMAGGQQMLSRTITAGMTLDAWLAGGAGGSAEYTGDYAYRDSRQPFAEAGLWGIFRVLKPPSGSSIDGSGSLEKGAPISIQ